jgi:hypothetical protein
LHLLIDIALLTTTVQNIQHVHRPSIPSLAWISIAGTRA